jgi:TonB family protein
MKNTITIALLFISIVTNSQVKIKNDSVKIDDKFIKIRSIPSDKCHIDYYVYSSNSVLLRKCRCLSLKRKIKGTELYNYIARGVLLKDGPSIEFYPNGNYKEIYRYDENKNAFPWSYYSVNGKLCKTYTCDSENYKWVYQFYDNNEKIYKQTEFSFTPAGTYVEMETYYYKSGIKKSEISYNGLHKLDGISKFYSTDGFVERIETFGNNKSIACQSYSRGKNTTCDKLIDSLYLGYPNFEIEKKITNLKEKLAPYWNKDSAIIFSFTYNPDNSIEFIQLDSLAGEDVKSKIRQWILENRWINEKQLGVNKATTMNFVLQNRTSDVFIERNNKSMFDSLSIYTISDEPSNYIAPSFPGGEKALYDFIQKTLVYPKDVISLNTATVYVKFTVDTNGSLCNFEIVGGEFYKALDDEAMRVASLIPNWIPGSKYGRPVSISFTLPISFLGTH